ncbi:MAG: PLP-dependent aminotransferase family protein [Deltaproteobacteria bacterium]|nr:PLP-dependent aminotransferase family protein [Deltaproteobacteria bacterium]
MDTSLSETSNHFHYIRLADDIENKILGGIFRAGEKLPSIRKLHDWSGFSITTVYQAYIELEKRGVIETQPKSGFYVRSALPNLLPAPKLKHHKPWPRKVSTHNLINTAIEAMSDPDIINLGCTAPASDLLPHAQLLRIIKSTTQKQTGQWLTRYELPAGSIRLRREIAKRISGVIPNAAEDDIIVTNGCMEAISICLRAVARPGDTILVESPSFHCFLQLIEDQDMLALEIPTDPDTGMDLDSLETVLKTHNVKACILNPNFQNPMGFVMPIERKQRLLQILGPRGIPIIEDNICGELYFDRQAPVTLKSMDAQGMVLHCASFSKTLSPGLRIGWTLPGRFKEQVQRIKINTSISTSSLNQHVIADFLESGAFDRHLRRLRTALKSQLGNTALAIARYFPQNTRITCPKGGLMLWVELDETVDTLEVFQQAMKERIAIIPGIICATTDRFRNCMRISCGSPWNEQLETTIARLGQIVSGLLES